MTAAPLVIAIDGPAAAGKSTLARALARRLGITYLDTGATYRALALAAREAGIDWDDAPALTVLAGSLDLRFGAMTEGGQQVSLGTREISDAIRSEAIGEGASVVSAHPAVRAALVALQRRIAASQSVVAEGRDTTTVVFPNATVKFFLLAERPERSRRRAWDLTQQGLDVELSAVEEAMAIRDERDSTRAASPLIEAPDAIRLDSTDRTPADVLAIALAAIQARV